MFHILYLQILVSASSPKLQQAIVFVKLIEIYNETLKSAPMCLSIVFMVSPRVQFNQFYLYAISLCSYLSLFLRILQTLSKQRMDLRRNRHPSASYHQRLQKQHIGHYLGPQTSINATTQPDVETSGKIKKSKETMACSMIKLLIFQSLLRNVHVYIWHEWQPRKDSFFVFFTVLYIVLKELEQEEASERMISDAIITSG